MQFENSRKHTNVYRYQVRGNKRNFITPNFKSTFYFIITLSKTKVLAKIIEISIANKKICASNCMFGRAIWEKLLECVFEYSEIAWVKQRMICASNHMFKRKIWDKFTEFTFLKFWDPPSETREISKFQKINEVNFPQILRINI